MNEDNIVYTSESDNFSDLIRKDFCSEYAPEPPSDIIQGNDFSSDYAPDPPASSENN